MDVPSWRHELEADLPGIQDLIVSMALVAPEDDAKLQHLKGIVAGKSAEPLNPGNRKVIIFTAFADTANYLYANFAPTSGGPMAYKPARSTGAEAPKTTLQEAMIFSPF